MREIPGRRYNYREILPGVIAAKSSAPPLKSKPGDRYEEGDLKRASLLLFSEANLDVYYAPFHMFNSGARVVLVGLTPGFAQMEQAYRGARLGLSLGYTADQLHNYVDKSGSFSGPLRKHLVTMLDDINLNQALGLASVDAMFAPEQSVVAFTSVVSAPVFLRGQNFNGSAQRLFRSPRLRDWVLENLAKELISARNAIVIPLGTTANAVVEELIRDSSIGIGISDKVLRNFPHPSGANGHRKPQFDRGQMAWKEQIRAHFRTVG